MAFNTIDEVKKDIQVKQELSKIKTPPTFDFGLGNSQNRIESTSYEYGVLGSVFDRTREGNYEAKYINYLGFNDNENRLALQQSTLSKIGNGLTKSVAKVGLYIADGVNMLTNGLYQGISEGRLSALWDNNASNFLDEQEKRLDRKFYNYYSNEEKSQNILQRAFTNPANFLANDIAGGLAFVAGAVLPELAIGAFTGGGSLISTAGRLGSRAALREAVSSADNIAAGIGRNSSRILDDVAEATNITTRSQSMQGLRALNRSNNFSKVGQVLNTGRFIAQSTFFEAGMEARHNFHDNIDRYVKNYEADNGESPTIENLTSYIDDARKSADYVFGANVALLSVTNAVMFGKTFGLKLPSFSGANRAIGLGVEIGEKGVANVLNPTRTQKILGKAYYIGRKPFSEGVVEEGLQGVFNKTSNNYLNGKYDPKNNGVYSLASSIQDAFSEQYGTKEGWNEIGIGMIIGSIGGNVGALGGRGEFGISGLTKGDSYSSARNTLQVGVEARNKGLETFRNMNRTGSILNFQNPSESENVVSTYEDTLSSYSYIQAQKGIKEYVDIIEDYNTAVDGLEFTPAQMEQLNLRDPQGVEAYKSKLKTDFQTDYAIFEKAERVVESLGLDRAIKGGKKGNIFEVKDALTFNLMMGEKAGQTSLELANQIETVIGESGVYDSLRFYNNLDEKQRVAVDMLQEKQDTLKQLREEAVNIAQNQSVNSIDNPKYKEYARKSVLIQDQIRKLESEISNLETNLNSDLMVDGQSLELTSPQNFNDITTTLEKVQSIRNYVQSLKSTGKVREAQDLEYKIRQFENFSDAEAEMVNIMRRMSATNFFTTDEGKGLLRNITGESYTMSDDFIKEINDSEATIDNSLQVAGIRGYESVQQVLKTVIEENQELSDREKFRLESLIRLQIGTLAIQARMESVTEGLNFDVENFEPTSTETLDNIDLISPEIVGDTVEYARKRSLETEGKSNIQILDDLISDITQQLDFITNKPTAASLKEIKEKETELERLRESRAELELKPTIEINVVSISPAMQDTSVLGEPITSEIEDGTLYEFTSVNGRLAGTLLSPTEFRIDGITANEVGQGQGSIMFEALIEYMKDIGVTTISTVSAGAGAVSMHQRAVDKGLLKEVSKSGRTATFEITTTSDTQTEQIPITNVNQVIIGETLYDIDGRPAIVTSVDGNSIVMDRNGSTFTANPRIVELYKRKAEENATKESEKQNQEGDQQSNINERQRIDEGQQVEGQTERSQRETAEQRTDSGNSNFESERQIVLDILGQQLQEEENKEIRDETRIIELESQITENGGRVERTSQSLVEQNLDNQIEVLQNEINELRTPFKLEDTDSFKKYNTLLKKQANNTITSEEQTEMDKLEVEINQWIYIAGTRANGLELTDLIKQMAALQEMQVLPIEQVNEVTSEQIEDDTNISDSTGRNNYRYGQNWDAVTAVAKKGDDGEDYIEIAGISRELLETISGMPIPEILTPNNTIYLNKDTVEAINNLGNVVIMSTNRGMSTRFSIVLKPAINIQGENTLVPLKGDYGESYKEGVPPNPQTVYELHNGQKLVLRIDSADPYNKELLDQFRKQSGRNPAPTGKERAKAIESEIEVLRSKDIVYQSNVKALFEVTQKLRSRSISKEERAKLNKEKAKYEKTINSKNTTFTARAEVKIDNPKQTKARYSKELLAEIKAKIVIKAIDGEGNVVSILKGLRGNDLASSQDRQTFEQVRATMTTIEELEKLLDLDGLLIERDLGVTVEKVLPGHPSFNYRVEDGIKVIDSKPITEQDIRKIDDIGIIQNGKLETRKGLENVDLTFVGSAVRNTTQQTPVVIIVVGAKRIAYPVTIGRQEAPVSGEDLQKVFNSNINPTEKAIRLNSLLAGAGVDIKVVGNAFTVLSDNNITQEFLSDKIAQIENIEYFSNLNQWLDSRIEVADVLQGASINIDMTKPFHSPKVKFNFRNTQTTQVFTEEEQITKKTDSKQITVNKVSALNAFRQEDC